MSEPLRCLVVDDEKEICEFIGSVIDSSHSATITYAACGNEAIEILRSRAHEFDVVICDYKMCNGNGGDVYRFMMGNSILTPFILVSSDQPSDHPEFAGAKIAGFAEKPMFLEPLLAAVGEIAKNKQLAQSA